MLRLCGRRSKIAMSKSSRASGNRFGFSGGKILGCVALLTVAGSLVWWRMAQIRVQEQLFDRLIGLVFDLPLEPKRTSQEAAVEAAMNTLARERGTSAPDLLASMRTRVQWTRLTFEPDGYEGAVLNPAAGNVARGRRAAADNRQRVQHWREAYLYGHLLFSRADAARVAPLFEQALQLSTSDCSAPRLQIKEQIALLRIAEGKTEAARALWNEIAAAPPDQSRAEEVRGSSRTPGGSHCIARVGRGMVSDRARRPAKRVLLGKCLQCGGLASQKGEDSCASAQDAYFHPQERRRCWPDRMH